MKKFLEFFLGFGDGNKQGSNHSKIIQKLFSTNYRGVFRTLSNTCDGAHLRKWLTAKSC